MERVLRITLVLLAMGLGGCATVAGSAGGFPERADAFQQVQSASDLQEALRHPAGAALYPLQARQLWSGLVGTPVTQRSLGPRLLLSWLVRGVLARGERVDYLELLHRLEPRDPLVVVRPDGYLVTALTGEPIQRLGTVKLEQGELRVGRLVVGTFYASRAGVLYPVDEALRRLDTPPWGELGLEHDWLDAALDGAQDATGELAHALAQSVLHPIQGAEDLAQLPTTVARLIAASPEYFSHYRDLSLQDQIREAARVSTHLMLLYGGGAGAVGRIGGLGAELPVVSLTAEGQLAVRLARIPVGTTTAVGTGILVGSLLPVASQNSDGSDGKGGKGGPPPPAKPPGRWIYKTPTTDSQDALRYQEQITGQPPSRVYMIEDVEFDGFRDGELQEVKGPRYFKFFNKDGSPKYWYEASGGFNELLEQARKQSKLADRFKLPLVWYVADSEVAKFLRALFYKDNK